jgi:polyadenylate-binding protein
VPGFGGPQGNYPMKAGFNNDAPPVTQSGTQTSNQQPNPENNNKTGLTASSLASATPEMQKQMLGERLYPFIHRQQPEYSGKITGMLLEMENTELLKLLDDQLALDRKIMEAMDVLKAHLTDGSKDGI